MTNNLYDILVSTAEMAPLNIAIEHGQEKVTYADLVETVKIIRDNLRESGIKQGGNLPIAIFAPKGVSTIATFLALNASGFCYVPIDTSLPLFRVNQLLTELDACPVLISDKYTDIFSALEQRYDVKKQIFGELHLLCKKIEPQPLHVDNIAYILFTSGSTGHPKGVVITNKNALSFIHWASSYFNLKEPRILSFASFGFDLSVFDIYVTFLSRGTLIIGNSHGSVNPRLFLQLVESQYPSVLYFTPSFLRLLAKEGRSATEKRRSVQKVLLAGEQLLATDVEIVKKLFPQADCYNLYGPTETNVCTAFDIRELPEGTEEKVPIGYTCPQLKSVLIRQGQPVETEGELCVTGPNVFAGYVKQEDNLNAFVVIDGNVYYRTGDLVAKINGLLYFLGRIDRMIKKGGYRVEPAEIEAILSTINGVNSCYVLTYSKLEVKYIAAFLATDHEFTIPFLKSYCASHLPGYMLPDVFVCMPVIPLNINGKPDVNLLMKKISLFNDYGE